MVRRNNKHRKALEKIATNPEKFGFKSVVSTTIESNLFHRGKIMAQPDITLWTSRREVHLVEYKGNGNGELLERAREQLDNAVWWYSRYRPDIAPEKIHTHIISGTDQKYKDLLR